TLGAAVVRPARGGPRRPDRAAAPAARLPAAVVKQAPARRGQKRSLVFELEGGADGAQDGLVLLQLQVVQLAHDQDGAVGAVEAPRPAGVGQVQAGEADVVADGGLAGEGIDTLVGLQVGVVLAQGLQGGVGDVVAVGAVLVERQQEGGRVRALEQHGPARLAVLALQAPVLRVLEADAVILEALGHEDTALSWGRNPLYFTGRARPAEGAGQPSVGVSPGWSSATMMASRPDGAVSPDGKMSRRT